MHIERFGTSEVEDIEYGKCFIFYKIDGTNGSLWLENGELKAGSRNRELSIDNDNAGFYNEMLKNKSVLDYLKAHPNHRLYGEWLVPHSLKTYRKEAWRKFYVFDVAIIGEEEYEELIPYELYQPMLEEFGIEYIPPLGIITNPNYDSLIKCLEKTGQFLVEDGSGVGEGIVIKNYDFYNKYKRQTWAKIVCNEFKEKHVKTMGANEINLTEMVEEKIVDKYCTEAFIEKEYAKICVENDGWSSKFIPMLLNKVYYELIKEETWNFLKEFKSPKIDFKTLNSLVTRKIKEIKSDIFR